MHVVPMTTNCTLRVAAQNFYNASGMETFGSQCETIAFRTLADSGQQGAVWKVL